MYPDPQEITLDQSQSHIFYHLLFIFNGSARCEVRLTFHIMARDTFFFLVPPYQETDVNVHSGFEAIYNMKKSVGNLTSGDIQYCVFQKCCCQCTVTVYTVIVYQYIVVSVIVYIASQGYLKWWQHVFLVTTPPTYIKAFKIIPQDVPIQPAFSNSCCLIVLTFPGNQLLIKCVY